MGNYFSSTPQQKTEATPTRSSRVTATRRVGQVRSQDGDSLVASKMGTITILEREKTNKLMFMAIDFGTTYSGYAYSFLNNPEEILTNYWQRTEIKTPTIVLMNENMEFHSFGLEAKEKYMSLIKTNKHKQWYYFENFKMKLFVQQIDFSATTRSMHLQPLDKDMKLADMFEKELPAVDVFAAAIKYMKEHFLNKLHNGKEAERLITAQDVHFILTVPAIWSDLSKQFMRKAAIQAGIPDDALSLALEPEAASLYCLESLKGVDIKPGTRYVVADLGGGTADFTCHEVNLDNTLKELHKPSGGDYGGTMVDNAFRNVLNRIFGAEILDRFKNQKMENYYELFDSFQLKKKNFAGGDKIVMVFPLALLDIFEDTIGESVNETLKTSPFKGRIEFKMGKMFIMEDLAEEIFNEAVNKIADRINELLKDVNGIEALVLVGGFSESPYLQKIMRKRFDQKTLYGSKKILEIVAPKEPASAVIRGAVMYGHRPQAIDSRVCKYSYGIARMMIFKDYHKEEKSVTIKGVKWCNDLFNKHIEVGEIVRVDDEYEAQKYFPILSEMKQAVLEVYASPHKNPKYIDDQDCQLVGLIRVDLTGGDINAKILVKLIFGGTELIVEALEETTNNLTVGRVDFLG